MKIMIISDAWEPQVNGVVRTYQHLRPELEGMGHQVAIIGPHDFPIHFSMPTYKEIDVALFSSSTLRKKIDDYLPDHIHIATEGPLGQSARRICLSRDVPFSTCYHTHFPDFVAKRLTGLFHFLAHPARAITYRHLRNFHEESSALFVATPTLKTHLQSKGFTAPFHPLTRGVNTALFHTGSKTLFQDLLQPIALSVGRIAVEKNIEAFLDAPWEGTKVVVGSGPDLKRLKTIYTDAVFMGHQEGQALADCYRSADVFTFPSRTDTFGMVIIEALSCGVPVAGYPVQGPIDILTSPLLGVTDESLGTAMRLALDAPGTRAQRSEYTQKTYSWREAATQFLAAVEK